MKANAKYTAAEILTEAGMDVAKLGKMAVTIGGIAGIVSPDHLIKLPADAMSIVVIVGEEKATINLAEPSDDSEISEDAKTVLEENGKIETTRIEKQEEDEAKVEEETEKQ
ncbi:MAG: hypothetical protein COY66_05000 [Candidatus Kerfeldbacteria bacterium CG_4_10_14_0_8_um_filter_42_10]|uniref:Uncharacterized protein n=1 Tax=Candidatus Kerfeldbacteria bacterium CG_4_10_14_0_8_um_filter_42_10 TaxID=2014248 RepID=A0A2M7RH81_9BACT|nr:MAG: hypothetical protein COY66_05000 [Candidatus Kerfeldbacteria bacterium CG_4_10_14_0_8_um_filter_42_10]